MKHAETAYDMCQNIVDLLREHGYIVDTVNNNVTVDSVVEHDVDLDVLGGAFMFNMNINVNRICTREEYVMGDEANPPRKDPFA